jgi:hypothetical protein
MSDLKLSTKLHANLQHDINLYKHQQKMNKVFHELLYIQCENCNKYVKKTCAINTEIVNYDFTFCGYKCYHEYSYRFTTLHKAIYGF